LKPSTAGATSPWRIPQDRVGTDFGFTRERRDRVGDRLAGGLGLAVVVVERIETVFETPRSSIVTP
jgi:hypothetical protein